jgi:hypothetical protein
MTMLQFSIATILDCYLVKEVLTGDALAGGGRPAGGGCGVVAAGSAGCVVGSGSHSRRRALHQRWIFV